MNRLFATLSAVALGLGIVGTTQAAKRSSDIMSFGFVQEFAGVVRNGEIRADLINSGVSYPQHIRIGAFGGEVLIDTSGNAFTATGIGYKHPINPKLAIYGKLFLNTTAGAQTNITVGLSYTGKTGNFIYNGNGHFTNATAGNVSTLIANGAGFYKLGSKTLPGSMYLGGELALQLSPSPTTTNIFLGARWMPKRSMFVDLGFATSGGGTTTLQTPAFVRLNIGL